jgi:replicative DNA helicase
LYKIRNAKLNTEETSKYLEAIRTKIYEKRGHILEMAKFNIAEIRKAIEEIKPKFIFVDYIQRFNLDTNKNLSRAAVLSDIVNELKAIAMEMGVVVITASQINRTADRGNVNIGALKESGAIEEASDIVILLSELEQTEREKAIKVVVAKNRHGLTGEYIYIFDRKNCDMRYSDEFTGQLKGKTKQPEFLKGQEQSPKEDWRTA